MEEYMKLIDPNYKIQVKRVPTGVCNGRKIVDSDSSDISDPDEPAGKDYIADSERKELSLYGGTNANNKAGSLSCVDTISELVKNKFEISKEERNTTANRVYNDYLFVQPIRDQLPIDTKKNDILSLLKITNVVIIQGDTGCGKTTQVPQYILDEAKENKQYCNIVVTQPRKIAALSVAKYICEERGWELGSICGYQVGLEKIVSPDTILTYVTAGVLLQKIITRRDLNEFTHIIIDEVHERTQEMDFLLILLRRFINTNSLGVKVILMSATFETEKFAYYFKNVAGGYTIPAPRIEVCKKTAYDKSIHYLEELTTLGEIPDYSDFGTAKISAAVYNIFIKLVLALNSIDDDDNIGHVLVFLPGIYEIEYVYTLLKRECEKGKGQFFVVPLHSTIPAHEQSRVFVKPPIGHRKIILSTNIAESSITVSDIVYVIDFCLTKVLVVDPATQFQSLKIAWASKTNCIQRAGRVGRVRCGRVYRLVYRDFYERDMENEIPPEMLRAPLDRVVLFSKRLEFAELPQSILGLALDPPDLKNINSTIKNLKEIGALLPKCRGRIIECDGDLTILGLIMTNLPIDVKLSKLICLGYLFSCLEECVIMAAGCSLTNVFSTPFQERMTSYVNKLTWSDGSCSDLIAHLALYTVFDNNKRAGSFSTYKDEKKWCENNFISYRAMKEWRVLVEEITHRLENLHVKPEVGPCHVSLTPAEKQFILNIVIAGAFYPNYYSRSCDGGQVDEKEVYKHLKGLNPNTSVYFNGMDMSQPGPLYEKRIKEIMRPVTNDCNVHFDTTSKIYITFNDIRQLYKTKSEGRTCMATMPGKICVDVFKAVRMRQLKMNTSFPVMRKVNAWKRAEELGIAENHGGYYTLVQNAKPIEPNASIMPKLGDEYMHLRISHVIDAGHFYAQPSHQQCSNVLEKILKILNAKETSLPLVEKDKIEVNKLYASKFSEDGLFYRCKVVGLMPYLRDDLRARIIYIDYGNTEYVNSNMLFELPESIATLLPQAIECTLCEVQPKVMLNQRGTWSNDANKLFVNYTQDGDLRAKIYSVVDDIVSVELFSSRQKKSINALLVVQNFGEKYEESLMSKENHELRERAILSKSYGGSQREEVLESGKPIAPDIHVDPPSVQECVTDITLRGPFSPLEMSVYPLYKNVGEARIDSESVNCVLLDAEPQDPHERLLVATYVSQNQHTMGLSLRHTTLMPAIRGLPSLVALIFCPTMLLKASENGSSYVSMISGLGVNAKRHPIFPEHDLRIIFDVEIKVSDLNLVNEIRFCMNKLMEIMQMKYENCKVPDHRHHRELKTRLFKLMETRRESKERVIVGHSDSWTKSVYQGTIMNPAGGAFKKDEDIWPLHSIIALVDNDRNSLKQHIVDLSDMAKGFKSMEDTVVCNFCNVTIATIEELRLHLCTTVHMAKITIFNANED